MALESLAIQPDAAAGIDTYLSNGANATSNFGTSAQLLIGTVRTLGVDVYNRAILRFDFADLPPSAVLVGATVQLRIVTNSLVGTQAITVYGLANGVWTELGATWNKFDGVTDWTTAGGDFEIEDAGSNDYEAGNTVIGLDVTDLVLAKRAAGETQLDLLFKGPEVVGLSNYISCRSSDDATANLRPLLSLVYFQPTGALMKPIGKLAEMLSVLASVQERFGTAPSTPATLARILYPILENDEGDDLRLADLPAIVLCSGDKWMLDNQSGGGMNLLRPTLGGNSIRILFADLTHYATARANFLDFGNWIGAVFTELLPFCGVSNNLSIIAIRQEMRITLSPAEQDQLDPYLSAAFIIDWN